MPPLPTKTIAKRAPQRKPTLVTDVYVSRKSNFKALCKRCENLLKAHNHAVVHGLGAAVSKAVSVALAVQAAGTDIDFEITTSTVNLIDDLIEDDEEKEDSVSERKNSAIHIRIIKKTTDQGQIN